MSDYFPREILAEIFHRLPLKSLVTCTSVCKPWKSLITDRAFISYHFTRTTQVIHGNESLILELYRLKKKEGNEYLEEFHIRYSDNQQIESFSILKFPFTHLSPHEHLSLVGTCNGLLCLADHSVLDSATVILWNPSVRKYVMLPKPSITFSNSNCNRGKYRVLFGFGFDYRTEDFKVVRLVTLYDEQDTLPQIEVYSLASGSWRSVTCKASPFLTDWVAESPPQMLIHGVIHWVVSRKSGNQIDKFILSFDVSKETFGELMIPKILHALSCFKVDMSQGGDSLTLVTQKEYFRRIQKSLGIEVMKEFSFKDTWTKIFYFNSRCCYGCIKKILALRKNGEVVLELLSGAIVLVDPVKKLIKDLGSRGFCDASVGCYVESLFLMDKESDALSY